MILKYNIWHKPMVCGFQVNVTALCLIFTHSSSSQPPLFSRLWIYFRNWSIGDKWRRGGGTRKRNEKALMQSWMLTRSRYISWAGFSKLSTNVGEKKSVKNFWGKTIRQILKRKKKTVLFKAEKKRTEQHGTHHFISATDVFFNWININRSKERWLTLTEFTERAVLFIFSS